MDFFTQLALKNRLLLVLVLSISSCFIIAATFFSYEEEKAFLKELHQDMAIMSALVNQNVAPSLLYGATESALEALATLAINPAVESAILFSSDGTPFAVHQTEQADHPITPAFRLEGMETNELHHTMYTPIYLDESEKPIGSLYIKTSTHELNTHMLRYNSIQGLMLVGILAITVYFGYRLQNAISMPYRNQQIKLKKMVAQRTIQLDQLNTQLMEEVEERKVIQDDLKQQKNEQQELITKLEQAQNRLLQSEKLASIGQLAAGVAHEINNPVGFIASNLNTLKKYVADLLEIIDTYSQADEALKQHPKLADVILQSKTKTDFTYLAEDISDLLGESQEGVERVKKIVQDLKTFSRSDSADMEQCDIHAGIDSTLNVAWSELKYKTKVVKEYGELPLVNCTLSKINQVLMNLLINAAQAVVEQGVITLRTGQSDDRVWIEVEDTGKGIAPDSLNRIFEPFYTTKPPGKGTGLGLSLSYGIIQDHGGDIEVESEVGRGTCFRIWLPIAGPADPSEAQASEADLPTTRAGRAAELSSL